MLDLRNTKEGVVRNQVELLPVSKFSLKISSFKGTLVPVLSPVNLPEEEGVRAL